MESEGALSCRLGFLENRIVQRIFYFPSAVGKPASHTGYTRTVRRIRTEGHDRQKH